MRFSRLLLLVIAVVSLLYAQTPEERKRFQEIQQKHNRGEAISDEDMKFAKSMMARMKQQQAKTGVNPENAEWAKTHPPRDTTGLVPLTDLGKGVYQGFEGGLYPGGGNEPPAAHLKAGLKIAKTIVPLDADGKPSPDGKVVLLSCGMSNTTMEFSVFQKKAADD